MFKKFDLSDEETLMQLPRRTFRQQMNKVL
jgi:hypothetical protein